MGVRPLVLVVCVTSQMCVLIRRTDLKKMRASGADESKVLWETESGFHKDAVMHLIRKVLSLEISDSRGRET